VEPGCSDYDEAEEKEEADEGKLESPEQISIDPCKHQKGG